MKLRGYQQRAYTEAIAALEGSGGFLLTLEMRTGKTPVSLLVARHFRQPLLIVCPKVAIPVWQKHIKKFEVSRSINGIFLVNFESLVNNRKAWYSWAKKHRGFFMIVDEAHFIKDRGSNRSRVVRTVSRYSKYRLALTGTPIAQGLQDAWALYDYLGHIFGPWDDTWEGGLDGKLILGFESTYLVYGGFRNHAIVGYRNQKKFNRIFHRYQFRITLREAKQEGGKGHMVLRYQKGFFPLNDVAQSIYDDLQEELQALVNERKIKVPNVLSCVAKLQQICGGYVIEKISTGRFTKRGKEIFRKEVHKIPGEGKLQLLLQKVKPLGGKFIVICRFIHELEAAKEALEKRGYSVALVRGGIPYDGEFGTDAICMQIQSGMAVDMSLADTVIFYSLDYSYINFEQSRFRILSYDKNFGKYVFLLAKGTVDEVIYAAIKTKKRVADLVIDRFRTRGRHGKQTRRSDRKPEEKSEGKTRRRIVNFATT